MRRRVERQLAQTSELVTNAGWQLFFRPSAGMFLWARWPAVEDAADLVCAAQTRGVSFSPGAIFTPDNATCPWLRINVTYADDPRAKAFLQAPV